MHDGRVCSDYINTLPVTKERSFTDECSRCAAIAMKNDNLVISRAEPDDFEAGLDLIFSHLNPEQRHWQIEQMVHEAAEGRVSFDGIFMASSKNHLLGSMWCYVLPGRTAAVWPARWAAKVSSMTSIRLARAVDGYLRERNVRLAQSLVEMDCGPDASLLREAGFKHVADLLYMVSDETSSPESLPSHSLKFEPFEDHKSTRLAALIERTYAGTLDCPALNGVRDIADVLEGYRATGTFDPNRWFFVREGTSDVGCLLLTDHPSQEQWEIVYVGFIPKSRGHGWGLEVTRHAQWLTRQANRKRLVLAVDTKNEPAIGMYASAGFATWERRTVFVKVY